MRIMLRAGRKAGMGAAVLIASFAISGAAHADAASDAKLLTQLGLIEGHLFVGNRLASSDAKQASLHFHHPMKEIFGTIEADIKARGAADLGDNLKALEKASEGGGDVAGAYKAVMGSVDATEDKIAAPPAVVLASLVGMLTQATEEYAAAYPNDALATLEEYQDSMGFVTVADEIFDKIKPKLAEKDAAAATAIEKGLDDLLKAWPDINAPAKPVIDAASVKGMVEKIAASAAAFKA
jgi:hypothetical protein